MADAGASCVSLTHLPPGIHSQEPESEPETLQLHEPEMLNDPEPDALHEESSQGSRFQNGLLSQDASCQLLRSFQPGQGS